MLIRVGHAYAEYAVHVQNRNILVKKMIFLLFDAVYANYAHLLRIDAHQQISAHGLP